MSEGPRQDRAQYSQEVLASSPRLGPEDEFQFACAPGISCFNNCCADVNIVLTPFDILRLSRRLGLATTDFLARHTVVPFTEDQQLPFVFLKMNDDERRRCPFVSEKGCGVYSDRPWPCRMYPIGQASPADPATQGEAFFFLMKEAHCRGHEEKKRSRIREWIRDQGALEYETAGEHFKHVLLHPYLQDHHLEPARMEMFYMASYDLDKFRDFIFKSKFLARFKLEPEIIEDLRTDDRALMNFAFRWLRFALFGEMTMPINPQLLSEREKEMLGKTRT